MSTRRGPGLREPAIEARIEHALADLRPMLRFEDCGLSLVRWDERAGLAVIRVEGGCPDCGITAATYIQGIAAHLRRRVPEVRDVRAVEEDSTEHG
ncbi:MAG TPA: NifU family protein [Gemmatimonadaceae bacterium]